MKIKNLVFLFAALFAIANANAQTDEPTGFDGDNFSLEGALALFEKATSPEDFEKLLNTSDNYVNNLDLNRDGQTDYIRVEDHMDGDVHAIVLQVAVSKEESQDIAVIEIEKTAADEAMLQIIGNADVYGEEMIVEPYDEVGKTGGKGGPSVQMETVRVVVNVWAWPSVRFVYAPVYRPYVSPFYWGVRPRWYRPWTPRPWNVFRPRVVVYQPRFRVVSTHRVVRAHRVYTPVRRSSTVVRTRTTNTVAVRKTNRVGASKTTKTTRAVSSPNGRVRAGKTTTTTTRKNPRTGVTTTRKTTTKGVKKGNNKAGVRKTTTRKRKH